MNIVPAFAFLSSLAIASCGSDVRSTSPADAGGGHAGSSAGSAGASAGPPSGGTGGTGGSAVSGGSSGSAASGSGGLAALEACTSTASIDRITLWTAADGECTCTPVGNLLVNDGSVNVAKVQFMGSDWHVVPVLITNHFGTTADLSASAGITLTYSATAALHVQVRAGGVNWSGGDKWAADVPATSGTKQTLFIPFDATKWASLFGAPAVPFIETLKTVQGLVFVGNSENTVAFYGLRIQGFEPVCP